MYEVGDAERVGSVMFEPRIWNQIVTSRVEHPVPKRPMLVRASRAVAACLRVMGNCANGRTTSVVGSLQAMPNTTVSAFGDTRRPAQLPFEAQPNEGIGTASGVFLAVVDES